MTMFQYKIRNLFSVYNDTEICFLHVLRNFEKGNDSPDRVSL